MKIICRNKEEARPDKVSYMIIIGQKEVDAREISVRKRDDGDMGSMGIQQFMNVLNKEMEE